MYKIMIKHNPSANKSNTTLWKVHGTTTTTASVATFKEFETDDLEVLATEVVSLDKLFGHENIKIVKEIDATFGVQIVDDEVVDDETNNENTEGTTEPTEPDDTTGDDDGDAENIDTTP